MVRFQEVIGYYCLDKMVGLIWLFLLESVNFKRKLKEYWGLGRVIFTQPYLPKLRICFHDLNMRHTASGSQ